MKNLKFALLLVFVLALVTLIGGTVFGGTRTFVWAPSGTGFIKVTSGVQSGTASSVGLTTDVTGTLPIANGGTGQTSFAAGALVSDGGALGSVAPGTNGNVLTSNGSAWVSSAAPSGGITPTIGTLSASDLTISGSDPTFTDILTVNVTGTKFLIQGHAVGINNGAPMTPRLRVLVDGVETTGIDNYGAGISTTSSGVEVSVLGIVSGLSNASHAFKLQGSYGGSTWTIHTNSNPTRELATLIVTPVN